MDNVVLKSKLDLYQLKSLKLGFFIILSIFVTTNSFAQSIPNYQYTSEDGLCNDDVFDITKDKSGNIWLATDNGLSRFDGQRFDTYTVADGLASNTLTGVGTWGDTIIVGTYKQGLQMVIDNKIRPVFNTKDLPFNTYSLSVNAKSIAIDRTQRFSASHLINYYGRSLKKVTIKGKLVSYTSNTETRTFISLNRDTLYFDGKHPLPLPGFLKNQTIQCVEKDTKGLLWVVSQKTLFVLDNKLKVLRRVNLDTILQNDEAFSITIDKVNNVWLKTVNGFGFRIDSQNNIVSINTLLNLPKGILVRKLMFDDESNGLWIAMAGQGIFYLDKNFITHYDPQKLIGANPNILSIGEASDGTMWFGTNNELISLKRGRFTRKTVPGLMAFNQIITIGNKTAFIGNRTSKKYNQFPLYFENNEKYLGVRFSGDASLWQNKLYLNHYRYFKTKSSNEIEFYIHKLNLTAGDTLKGLHDDVAKYPREVYKSTVPERVLNSMLLISSTLQNLYNNKYLMPINNALLLVDDEKKLISLFPGSEYFIGSRILKVIFESPNRFYVLSDKGLGIYSDGKWILQAANRNGFDLSNATTATADHQGRLWVGSKNGLTIFYKDKAYQFTKATGLPSSSINCLYYNEATQTMWVGTNEGLAVFDIKKLSEARFARPTLQVEEIRSLKSQFTTAQEIILDDTDNYLSFQLNTREFVELKSAQFEYQLDNQSTWQPTTSQLVLSNLQFGKHTVYLRVKTPNGGSSDIKRIPFAISPPLYQNWYFWVVIAGILLTATYFQIERRRRIRNERELTTKQINELRQQGLASMLNPHFIFNSLNSIQYFVNTGDMENANDYLSKFGRLLRLNLDAAYENNIGLTNELTFINLYLQLEASRFKNKFAFDIAVSPDLPVEKAFIPAMMIQPFLENAVLHGILPLKQRKGHLLIQIAPYKTGCIEIIIEDNGVGFSSSKNKHDTSHTSRALDIINKRIALMQEAGNDACASLEITDAVSSDHPGTRVRLVLPFVSADRL